MAAAMTTPIAMVRNMVLGSGFSFRSRAASLILIGGVFQVFDGVQGVSAGVLRGTGDTRVPMLLHLGGFWGVGIPLSLGLGFAAHLGPRGIWWGFVGSIMTVALLQLLRVRWRLAQDIRRLELDETSEYAVTLE